MTTAQNDRTAQPLDPPPTSRRLLAAIIVALVVLTAIPYLQVVSQDFVNYDDSRYITDNPFVLKGITWDGVKYAFGLSSGSQYHPLAWLSHMLDVQLFGVDAGKMKLVNVFFHCINAVLVFFLLRKLSRSLWPAAILAGVWALHPLRVEAVAWASERREVLYSMFGLLTLLAYIAYGERRSIARYLLVYLLFVLTLLCKPMLVTLPCVLLLMDFWPLGRFRLSLGGPNLRRFGLAVLEKLPMVPIVVISSWFTVIITHNAGAVTGLDAVPFHVRLSNMCAAYLWYFTMTIAPHDLTVFYVIPESYPPLRVAAGALLLIAGSGLAFWLGRRRGFVTTGWFMFVGTLVPVIGLMQVGGQAYADRYSYFTTLGLFIIAACGLAELSIRYPIKRSVVGFVAASVALIFTVVTWLQVTYWDNSLALWERSLLVEEKNPTALNNLGNVYSRLGNSELARTHWKRAVEIYPFSKAAANLAMDNIMLAEHTNDPRERGRLYAEAQRLMVNAIKGKPNDPFLLSHLATILIRQGRYDGAVEVLRVAVESRSPRAHTAEQKLKTTLIELCLPPAPGARSYLCTFLHTTPERSSWLVGLIDALIKTGRVDLARGVIASAVRCMPDDPRWSEAARNVGLDPQEILSTPLGGDQGVKRDTGDARPPLPGE